MSVVTVGRPTRPEASSELVDPPIGGHGLVQDELLIFELDGWAKTGVDLPEAELDASDLLVAHEVALRAFARAGGQSFALFEDLGERPEQHDFEEIVEKNEEKHRRDGFYHQPE